MELAIRTGHDNLVAGLEGKDIRGGDTGHQILKAYLWFGLERRGGYSDGKHYPVTLLWIVGHGVSTRRRHGVGALEREQAELLPCWKIAAE